MNVTQAGPGQWVDKKGVVQLLTEMSADYLYNVRKWLHGAIVDEVDYMVEIDFDDVRFDAVAQARIDTMRAKLAEVQAEIDQRAGGRDEWLKRLRRRPRKIKIHGPESAYAGKYGGWNIEILQWDIYRGAWRHKYGCWSPTLREAVRQFRDWNPYYSDEYHNRFMREATREEAT